MENKDYVSLKPIIGHLEKCHQAFNKQFFNGELEKPVITIMTDPRHCSYGWYTCYRAWADNGTDDTDDKNGYFEINVVADRLNRPVKDLLRTLLHEMVHQFNYERGIQDCSRKGTYHNDRFKQAAESVGLVCTKEDKIGWATREWNEDTWSKVEKLADVKKFASDEENLIHRKQQVKATKIRRTKVPKIKYHCYCSCGECDFKTDKKINAQCCECGQTLCCEIEL